MERALDASGALPHAVARVLLVLARYANDDGTKCFPSLETIASASNMMKPVVVRCIAQLRDAKLIEQERGGGRGRVSHYRLTLNGPPQTPETVTPRDPKSPVDNSVNGHATLPIQGLKGNMRLEKGNVMLPDSNKTQEKEKRGERTFVEEGKEAPKPDPEPLADPAAVKAALGAYRSKVHARYAAAPGCKPIRTPDQQFAALAGPPRLPKPVEPVRSVEEQLAILLAATAQPTMEAVL